MSTTFETQATFEDLTCGKCGVQFWVPRSFYRDRHEQGGSFYCPNGHERVFRERDNDRLKRELEQSKLVIQQRENQLAEERMNREAAERKATRLTKKARKYAAAIKGQCPYCKCTFENVAKHMQTQHKKVVALTAIPSAARRGGG